MCACVSARACVCVCACVSCLVCVYALCGYGTTVCACMSIRVFLNVCMCVCVCVYIFFLSLTMKYLTLSILFQFIEGEGIPTGGDRIGYTYTLTPIIKLSYFLFNRYKTTTALPWLFISTFVPSLVHSITSRACLSRLSSLPRPSLSFSLSPVTYIRLSLTTPPHVRLLNALQPSVHNVVSSQHRRRRVRFTRRRRCRHRRHR